MPDRRSRLREAAALLVVFQGAACLPEPSTADLTPLEAIHRGDTVHLSVSPNLVRAGPAPDPTLRISGLPFPTDVAELAGGRVLVLDRLDARVALFDSLGSEEGRLGRRGEGPGEYEEPYALAASGDHLAVWDKTGRLTILRLADGGVAGTTSAVRGDLPTAWQRMPTSQWEEPLQLSREDVTRRIWSLGGGRFGVMIQDRDERLDSVFRARGEPARFTHHVVVVDSLARVLDTLLALPGQELRMIHASSTKGVARLTFPGERPFPLRPMWTTGDGWDAWGHGSRPGVTVALDGGDTLHVTWPRDDRPLSDPDYHAYLDWEVEAYRRTEGERVANEVGSYPREPWIEEELAPWEERPQLFGLLGYGRCLAVAGFQPEQGPHGEAGVWIVLNMNQPTEMASIDVRSGPGFTRDFGARGFYYIEVEESGARVVNRMPLEGVECGGGG